MQFLDKTKIRIISGRGGNGMVAWRREKYVDKGGPAGGDGGKGGDVYLIADENMSTLMDFKYKSVFKAESGENGRHRLHCPLRGDRRQRLRDRDAAGGR